LIPIPFNYLVSDIRRQTASKQFLTSHFVPTPLTPPPIAFHVVLHRDPRYQPTRIGACDPLEIASEMARLVLEMGDGGTKSGSNWERLKILAEHFLRIAGHSRVARGKSDSFANIGNSSSDSGWKM